MIHCLVGHSLETIFTILGEKIHAGNKVVVKQHAFYQNVFGKDYREPKVQPHIECLLDIIITTISKKIIKNGLIYPFLAIKNRRTEPFERNR